MKTREHVCFLGSVFICVLASQVTMMADAAIGGNWLGRDVVSAVELVMPVYEVFYALVMLFGMGACTVASLALGRGDVAAVRRHFTGAIFSSLVVMLLLGGAIALFPAPLVTLLCGNSLLKVLTQRYLVAIVPYFVIANIVVIGMIFTAMAGHPLWVMVSSLVQFAVNLSCNLGLIRGANMGIEALAYSSLISATAGGVVLLIVYFQSACPFRLTKCSLKQLFDAIGDNCRYGVGFINVNFAYMIMVYAMNRLVLGALGENALFCWSVVMMIYLATDYASTAANETSLSLGGRYLGSGDQKSAKIIYGRSLFFALGWIGVVLAGVFVFPRRVLPLFGAADASCYGEVLRIVALAIPFIAGNSIVNVYLIRLVQCGAIKVYCVLSAALFLAVPVLFALFHRVWQGGEKYAFLALAVVQIAICLICRKVLSRSFRDLFL